MLSLSLHVRPSRTHFETRLHCLLVSEVQSILAVTWHPPFLPVHEHVGDLSHPCSVKSEQEIFATTANFPSRPEIACSSTVLSRSHVIDGVSDGSLDGAALVEGSEEGSSEESLEGKSEGISEGTKEGPTEGISVCLRACHFETEDQQGTCEPYG